MTSKEWKECKECTICLNQIPHALPDLVPEYCLLCKQYCCLECKVKSKIQCPFCRNKYPLAQVLGHMPAVDYIQLYTWNQEYEIVDQACTFIDTQVDAIIAMGYIPTMLDWVEFRQKFEELDLELQVSVLCRLKELLYFAHLSDEVVHCDIEVALYYIYSSFHEEADSFIFTLNSERQSWAEQERRLEMLIGLAYVKPIIPFEKWVFPITPQVYTRIFV